MGNLFPFRSDAKGGMNPPWGEKEEMSVCSVQRHGKLWGIWVLALLLLLPCLPAKAATAIGDGVVGNSSYVNLGSQPTQSSTRLGYYQPGVWVEITGESVQLDIRSTARMARAAG